MEAGLREVGNVPLAPGGVTWCPLERGGVPATEGIARAGRRSGVWVGGSCPVGPIHERSEDAWSITVEQLASSIVRTGSHPGLLSLVALVGGRDARSLLTLGAETIRRVPVDRAPERLPNSLKLGLDKSEDGGLS